MIPAICDASTLHFAPSQTEGRIKSVAIGIIAGLALFAVASAVSYAIIKRYPNLKISQNATKLFNLFENKPVLHQVWKAGIGLLVVVGAPIIEETLFRGLLDRKINEWNGENHLGKKIVRVVLVALLFGAAHMSPFQNRITNLVVFGSTTAGGLVLGMLKEARGDLATPMTAHAVYNLGAVLSL